MNRLAMFVTVAAVWWSSGAAEAQWANVYYGAPTRVYYQPAAAVPTTLYYAPASRTAYFAPAPVAVAPVYATRYRTMLRGSITRVRNRYAPVVYAYPPAPAAYYPAF